MNKARPIAWVVSKDSDGKTSAIGGYLESVLLPLLKDSCDVMLVELGSDTEIDDLQKRLYGRLPIYNFESSSYWQLLDALARRLPGIIWLHQLYHLTDKAELISLSEDSAKSNTVLISDRRYLAEFGEKYPYSDHYLLQLPAIAELGVGKEGLSICAAGTAETENNLHRLFSCLRDFSAEYKFSWLVSDSELANARRLVDLYQIKATLIAERDHFQWRQLCQESSYSVFLSGSAITSLEPYVLTSIASGATTILSARIQRACYPRSVVLPISLGASLERELAKLFYSCPAGIVSSEVVTKYLADERSPASVVKEILFLGDSYVATV